MISVRNLVKVYKSKRKSSCVALNEVSFDLPNKGMIFVLGESGSGKSTLLNILGGLDDFTSGQIVVDGNELGKLKASQYFDYRGSYMGFVFQDYCLIDEMTVRENVTLALDINADNDYSGIDQAMKDVGVFELADRYPDELSGGQKQRVAIARAIVKRPKVILCDEPTGNLDRVTADNVLALLKELSEKHLIVLVSHNREDAFTYADRILILGEGKIINDLARVEDYENSFEVKNDTAFLPYNKALEQSQVEVLQKGLDEKTIKKVVQKDSGFEKSKPQTYLWQQASLKRPKTSFKQSLKLSGVFMKRRIASYLLTAILATLLVSCFALFQAFLDFNTGLATTEILQQFDQHSLVLQKGTEEMDGSISKTYLKKVQQEEIDQFVTAGYVGNVYKLYNHALLILPNSGDAVSSETNLGIEQNVKNFYIRETYGVLQCDREFLAKAFGDPNQVELWAGDLEGSEEGEIFITDYVADSIIFFSKDDLTYEDLIGFYSYTSKTVYGKIGAVIKTGYQEKYSRFIELAHQFRYGSSDFSEALKTLAQDTLYVSFAEDVKLFLGISYTFADDYLQTLCDNPEALSYGKITKFAYTWGETTIYKDSKTNFYTESFRGVELAQGEISLPYQTANELFGTSYNSSTMKNFTPMPIAFSIEVGGELVTKTMVVKSLNSTSNLIVSDEDLCFFRPLDVIAYALYFDNVEQAEVVCNVGEDMFYATASLFSASVQRIGQIFDVFKEIFILAEVVLVTICCIFLVNFGVSSVRANNYQIGVIKALGSKTSQISSIFVRQTLMVSLLILLLSVGGIYLITHVANAILMVAFRRYLPSMVFELTVVKFVPKLVLGDLSVVLAICLLSAFLPIIAIHKIKPIKIIKAKE